MPANSQGLDVAEQLIGMLERGPVEEQLGGVNQVGNPGYAARSNCYSPANLVDGALAATGVGCFVPVSVSLGDVISKVSLPIGATAGATITHQFAAIFAGAATLATSVLEAQSTDTTSAAIPASTVASWTLASQVAVTPAVAPHGFVYAFVSITASTVPTAGTVATPTGINYQWFSTGPFFWSATGGSALAGTAPANLGATALGGAAAAKAVAPVVILT